MPIKKYALHTSFFFSNLNLHFPWNVSISLHFQLQRTRNTSLSPSAKAFTSVTSCIDKQIPSLAVSLVPDPCEEAPSLTASLSPHLSEKALQEKASRHDKDVSQNHPIQINVERNAPSQPSTDHAGTVNPSFKSSTCDRILHFFI